MKYYFVINPKSGEENATESIKEKLKEYSDYNIEVYVTKAPKDATQYVKTIIEQNPGEELRFIACGGDGTFNEVAAPCVNHDNVSAASYPCGSGNDLIKAFGDKEKFLNIKSLLDAKAVKIDSMKVNDDYSFNVTNFGFDTTVAITINKERDKTGHGNKGAYAKGVATALLKAMKNKFTVTADDEVINPTGKGLLCTLANGQYVGGSFKCAPRSKPDDGLIEVCYIKEISRIKFLTILSTYTNGEHLESPKTAKIVKYKQAKKIHVEAPEGFAYSLDGEIIYNTKMDVEILPLSLNFVNP